MRTAPNLALALPPPVAASERPPTRRRWLLPAGGLLLALLALGGATAWLGSSDDATWRTAPATTADVRQVVSATGTLSAVTTVDVGTQVSGVITALPVDFNDEVTAGQLIATIDPTLLEADVASARATLAQRQAERQRARQDNERVAFLAERDAASTQELQAAISDAAAADAQVASARVALARAERNLGYAAILSPIDGTVVDRLVDVGQTVNAGTSAPTLFTLAGDLKRMQILATVDEADIGQLEPDQRTTFTVQAYPSRTFEGRVRQVRLQSTTTDSVVTYTVVVDVDNPERQLLPGMTANVSFVVAEASDVLTVPAAALRFKPPGTERARGDGVYVIGADGALQRQPVEVGLSDGSATEIRGEALSEGTAVVTGMSTGQTETSASPFQSNKSEGGPGGPPGGF